MTEEDFLKDITSVVVKEAKSSVSLPAKLHKKELDAKLRMTLCVLSAIWNEDLWEDMGQILLCGRGADEYYDLIGSFCSFLAKNHDVTAPLVAGMDQFCTEVPEEVYCKMLRTFALKYCTNNGPLYSCCAIVHVLLVEWYSRGMQSCGWDKTRVSLFSQADVSLLELIAILFDICGKFNTNYSAVRQKDLRAIKSVLSILNGNDFVAEFTKILKVLVKIVDFNTLFSASVYSVFESLFSREKQANLCLHFLNVEREDFSKVNYLNGVTKVFLTGAGSDILKYRKLFVREKGVTLRFNQPFDRIDEVTLREVHEEELHYVYLRYCLDGKLYRNLVLNIENLETSFMTFMYEVDFSLTLGILCWLGLKDKLLAGLETVEYLESEPDAKEACKEVLIQISKCFKDENLHYSQPIWWNYEQTKSKPTISTVEYTKLISVATYSRRLPKGQRASEEAKALAGKYCMVLESGYTLVEGFERKQGVKKKMV